ncbi:MAG: sigma-70 family RNA polymerase sigma factor [Caulobacterales bacterium]|jgi:RNA polymerase sigma-70 factor (ECF subfamily)
MGFGVFNSGDSAGGQPIVKSSAPDPGAWIVRLAREGHRPSYVALFEHFAGRVKAYLMRRGLSDALAEDLAQETLLTVWRKAAHFDPSRASASAWIYTIARNLWIDSLRRERHPDDMVPAEPPSLATPEQALRWCESEQRLRQALAALSSDQAQVLRLAFFEERSHAEIANLLQAPLGTVKSRIRLATAHLRSALEDLQ